MQRPSGICPKPFLRLIQKWTGFQTRSKVKLTTCDPLTSDFSGQTGGKKRKRKHVTLSQHESSCSASKRQNRTNTLIMWMKSQVWQHVLYVKNQNKCLTCDGKKNKRGKLWHTTENQIDRLNWLMHKSQSYHAQVWLLTNSEAKVEIISQTGFNRLTGITVGTLSPICPDWMWFYICLLISNIWSSSAPGFIFLCCIQALEITLKKIGEKRYW